MQRRIIIHRHSAGRYRIPYEQELNPAQLQAVMHTTGAALVIAGAGTGKTRTLVYRVARLVEDGVPPESILLLTFTRKAAQEMLRRAAGLLDGRCEQVSGGTFHSFAHSILRRYGEHIGLPRTFTVLDTSDVHDVLNLLRSDLRSELTSRRFPTAQTLSELYSTALNRCQPLSEALAAEYPHFLPLLEPIEQLLQAYTTYKRRHGLVDYDDLLVLLLQLLEEHPTVRARLHAQYRFLMVDEYQDTNRLQHRITLLLSGPEENVMAVGDDAQSIYSFRGADFRNILEFPKAFQQCRLIQLEENYRSTQPILDFANAILARAAFGYRKRLFTRRAPEGALPVIVCTEDERQQSLFVVQQVLELREQGIPLEQIAVLARSAYLFFDLEIELARAGIPYRKFGGLKFTETAHIKDIIALARVLHNPGDVVSWYRALLLLEGVGPRTARRIVESLQQEGVRWEDPHRLEALAPASRAAVASFWHLLRRLALQPPPLPELLQELVAFYRPILERRYDDAHKRWKDLEMLLSIAERYARLEEFLADLSLEPPTESLVEVEPTGADQESPLVLSTVHSAKGLEWDAVLLIWATDGRFPPLKARESLESFEEERRLFYVACTRARRWLYIVYPLRGFEQGDRWAFTKVSPFVAELEPGIAEYWSVTVQSA
jgi:DNA helicase-2/ATP-dependent DNA helicase PcrA